MKTLALLIALLCLIGCADEGLNPVQTNELTHRTASGLDTLGIPLQPPTFNNEESNGYIGLETLTQVIGFLASQSTVHIKTTTLHNGQLDSYTGTGFFVENGWIATAYHVVENAYSIQVSSNL